MIVTLAQGMLFNENHAKKVSHNSCHSPCMMDFYALLEAFRGVLQSKCVLKKDDIQNGYYLVLPDYHDFGESTYWRLLRSIQKY